jgi:hypothetical protein
MGNTKQKAAIFLLAILSIAIIMAQDDEDGFEIDDNRPIVGNPQTFVLAAQTVEDGIDWLGQEAAVATKNAGILSDENLTITLANNSTGLFTA